MNQQTTPKNPSHWAIRFLEWFCPDELIEGILGDLLEQFDADCQHFSDTKANRRFIWNVFRLFHPSIILRNHITLNLITMGILNNYFKIAMRSFWKQKLSTSINIIGLTLGIVCASLAFVFVQHERSFNKFHSEHENIYWLNSKMSAGMNLSVTPTPLSPQLVENMPEVVEGLRLQKQSILVESGKDFLKEKALYVDDNFFSFFDFKLKEGAKHQVFSNTKSLVISEDMAEKYFGRTNPLGQNLTLDFGEEKDEFMISGVAENAPQNSSLQYSFLLPIQYAYREKSDKLQSDWTNFRVTSFIRLKEKEDLEALKGKLADFTNSKYEKTEEDGFSYSFALHAFDDYHLNNFFRASGLNNPGESSYVKILGLLGLLILVVACLNFMNLSNAKSSKRLVEVGVRKVLGARPRQLRHQFLSESILISLFSLLLGVLLIKFLLPYIENITGYALQVDWTAPSVFLPLLGITLLAGILAGIYPSFLLSRLKAVNTFKSKLKIGGNNWATKGSLIFQFAISVGLLSSTLIMFQQQQFIKNRNLGFNQEEIIVIPTQIKYGEKVNGKQLVQQYKQELHLIPEVKQVSGVSHSFNQGNQVQFITEEDGQNTTVFEYLVDAEYIPMLDIELLEGQNFSEAMGEEETASVIVNEAFLKKYEIENIQGYRLPEKFNSFNNAKIIGVVKDYHFLDLRQSIKPMFLHTQEGRLGNILVKINPTKLDQTLAQLKSNWEKIRPEKPFEFSFMDEDIQQQYLAEERWNKVISGATLLAILIACLGLFGLIALTLAQRTKEIGIRKILGASVLDITWLVSRQFVVLLLIASIIAIPVAVWSMQHWLENFAYQIDIQIIVFLVAIGITALLGLSTMLFQSFKAASQNPVKAIKND